MADTANIKAKRKQAEALIIKYMNAVDKSGANAEYYINIFAEMSDAQFMKYIKKDLPYKFHIAPFKSEPKFSDTIDGLDVLGVPLMEKITLPYQYKNKDGVPMNTPEAMVLYCPIKKMKQFLTKKNSMSTDIAQRDKAGLLVNFDKNGKTSDREFECLAIPGLNTTMEEFARFRADSMVAKDYAYGMAMTLGRISLKDVPLDEDDSLAKNLLNTYLLGSGLNSNLVNEDLYLPKTIKDRKSKVEREAAHLRHKELLRR